MLKEGSRLNDSRREFMLVLSRRLGETIVIDGNISITVVSVKGERVRIGVNAPHEVPVDRLEVHSRRSDIVVNLQPSSV